MHLDKSIKVGINFGITSGIITTLGLMVGLLSGTHSKLAVIGGILTIAIADALSDALGIRVSQEGSGISSPRQIWESTIATFLAKFLFALTFMIPVLLINNLFTAVVVNAIRGLIALGYLSYTIAKSQKRGAWPVIRDHVIMAIFVIVVTYFVGMLIHSLIG
ncbi:MAG: hypothetical protein NTX91_00615 [candidate division SR1 bacterium]|nr:hypothetical protein [candidate division SR1 bacterium]